jgi:antitoxin CcdA
MRMFPPYAVLAGFALEVFMRATDQSEKSKRRSVNLTIRQDVIAAAKALDLNVSQAAEAGAVEAIRQARTRAWREDNRVAIDAHNDRVEKSGVLLTPEWAKE